MGGHGIQLSRGWANGELGDDRRRPSIGLQDGTLRQGRGSSVTCQFDRSAKGWKVELVSRRLPIGFAKGPTKSRDDGRDGKKKIGDRKSVV